MAGTIEVKLSALSANLGTMRRHAPGANVAAVVKADAYGLGLAGVLPQLACDTYFVARLAEGVTLRALAPKARIFVFDGAQDDTLAALIAHRLIPVLGSLAEIARWQAAKGGEAALQVDTGMNRLGLPAHELAVLAGEAKTRLAGITLALVMSHLACSDDPASPMNEVQLSRFRAALAQLPPAPASLAASGGIFLGPDYHFDMVRPGIGLYGGNPHPGHANPMQPVVRLAAPILQLRPIAPAETVGYGGSFTADRPMTIATIALGYADGVLRAASGKAVAMVHGRAVPFVGRVSMDLVTLDVTGLDVAVGDMAELLGPALPLDEAAASWGTISYELLTGLSRRIPRIQGQMNPFAHIGRAVLEFLAEIGRLASFTGRSLAAIVAPPVYGRLIGQQFFHIGYLSLPVVGLTALSTGAVLALQIYLGGNRYGAEAIVPQIVVLAITRELGPVIAGLMVAGRVGAAIAAEIGTMKVTEQIDALTTLSTNPVKYLVVPRLVAAVISMPILTAIGNSIGIFGGYAVATQNLGFTGSVYLRNTVDFATSADIMSGLIKAAVFGFIIALMGCYHGFNSKGGAQGVGAATTNAVVSSCILILATDFVLTAILFSA